MEIRVGLISLAFFFLSKHIMTAFGRPFESFHRAISSWRWPPFGFFQQLKNGNEDAHRVYKANVLDELETVLFMEIQKGGKAVVWFDIDETILKRDVFFVHGFEHSEHLKTVLGRLFSHMEVNAILSDLESQYNQASCRLVSNALPGLIKVLQDAGHLVFGITFNERDSKHMKKNLKQLRKHQVSFSVPAFTGRLPRTAALVCDEEDSVHGIIYAGPLRSCSQKSNNKGAIIKEFFQRSLLNSNTYRQCHSLVLVDNTLRKLQDALHVLPNLVAIHYIEAEIEIDATQARQQVLASIRKTVRAEAHQYNFDGALSSI
uniref:Uncharacterized protein n=1 Tax=Heterosigma akashiwo TaxID=2829 RepID=A0A6V1QIX4_HETAK